MDLLREIHGGNPVEGSSAGPSLEPPNPDGKDSNGIEAARRVLDHLVAEKRTLKSLCRACLVLSSDMYSLVHRKAEELVPENDQLPDIFSSFADIQVDPDDGLPVQICEQCKVQLINSYEFKLKCLYSDTILKKYLKPMASCINAGTSIANNNLNDLLIKPVIKNEPAEVCKNERKVSLNTNFEKDNNIPADDCKNNNNTLPDDVKSEGDEDEYDEDVQYIIGDISESDQDNTCIVQVLDPVPSAGVPMQINILIPDTADQKEIIKKGTTKENKKGIKKKKVRKVVKEPQTQWPNFVCHCCQKKFKTRENVQNHIKLKHGTQDPSFALVCANCSERFGSEKDLRLHSSLHSVEEGVWTCTECQKRFFTRATMKRHIARHMESKPHECRYCNKRFAERYAMRRHARVHTGQQREKKYECHLCDKRFPEMSKLHIHRKTHTGERPFVCAECGKAFISARHLSSHSITHSQERPYQCKYCDKRFRHEQTRITHHRTHTGERPYVCTACGRAFIQSSNLSLHMRVHTGERPFKCDKCERCFASGSTLKSHQRTHTGDRPYTCHHCGKKFTRHGFGAHCRTHSDFRPHGCVLCPRRFASAARLRDHERVHTGERPYECANCQMKFTTKGQVQKHIKRHEIRKKKKERKKRSAAMPPVILIAPDDAKQLLFDPNAIIVGTEMEHPMSVSEELVLEEHCEINTDILVVDGNEMHSNESQSEPSCLDNSIHYDDGDASHSDDMNLGTIVDGAIAAAE